MGGGGGGVGSEDSVVFILNDQRFQTYLRSWHTERNRSIWQQTHIMLSMKRHKTKTKTKSKYQSVYSLTRHLNLEKKSAWRDELRRRLRTRLHRFSDARNDRKNKERVTLGNHGLLFQVAFMKKTQRLQNFHFILCWTNSVLYTIGSIVDYFKNSSLN